MNQVHTPNLFFVGASAATLATDGFACVDSTGELVTPAVATGLKTIGTLVVGSEGMPSDQANGSARFEVRIGRQLVLAVNDETDPVTVAHIGASCYVKDSHTVSSDNTGTSVAGVVKGFQGTKVLVQIN